MGENSPNLVTLFKCRCAILAGSAVVASPFQVSKTIMHAAMESSPNVCRLFWPEYVYVYLENWSTVIKIDLNS
jgi:hypothetical protein